MALAMNDENVVTIGAAGAIPLLVQLLGLTPATSAAASGSLTTRDNTGGLFLPLHPSDFPYDLKKFAAGALLFLTDTDDNKAEMVAAGAIPTLVQLLGPGSDEQTQEFADRTLEALGRSSDKNRAAIEAAVINAGWQLC
ncbi:hypothetical protein FOA52_011591 [Chlamydomonas sp. UWO 241]|nr:hypothetical protein FOA52_011591 [Chlamydomonas sp. UWO 241]